MRNFQGFCAQGSNISTSIIAKSRILRVTSVRPCRRATAAICASAMGLGRSGPVAVTHDLAPDHRCFTVEGKDPSLKLRCQIVVDPALEAFSSRLLPHATDAAHQFTKADRRKEQITRHLATNPIDHATFGSRLESLTDHVRVDQVSHYPRSTVRPVVSITLDGQVFTNQRRGAQESHEVSAPVRARVPWPSWTRKPRAYSPGLVTPCPKNTGHGLYEPENRLPAR